jgi:iron complex transport system permease protein
MVQEVMTRGTGVRLLLATTAGLVGFALVVIASLATGVEPIAFGRAWSEPGSRDAVIFASRATRVGLGALAGMALAPAGVAFQALLRNPLADPYILGVSGGAAVAGTLAIVFGLGTGLLGAFALPVWAFAGAFLTILTVFLLGRVRGRLVPNVALLAGVVVNALAGALVVAIRLVASPHASHQALYWLTGAIEDTEPSVLAVLALYVVGGVGLIFFQAVAMNAFALGDETAHALGVDTAASRRTLFFAASLLTGAAVAFCGPIGFVGIVVPHLLRLLVGPDHRILVPLSALAGGAFLVGADTLTRLAFLWLGIEPTVGLFTALIGAPFFLVLLRRRGKEHLL